ncbi:TetR/AcrR family transcriptional regulator [Dissulfurimicrobium hydrothermale]|uniref:TetR/AcrR family transcriptional regulator n=1 Tax=Dissulfurimicrobium hydrothermale TaxID=1750598 RepID=UPI001EDB1217|nr:TetR/AcrR family transcriptional regulator [Dissulfurimicrobium hydrothermale]UKL13161.1 TetR/AcrR family transcriptional regulator [Dissulfurimicrobium hydrothermale]
MTRKEAIIAAAITLFAQKGYAATTSEIAKAAGVAEGTIFHHFINKKGIIVQIFKNVLDAYITGMNASAKGAATGFDALSRTIAFHFRFLDGHSREFKIIARDCPYHLMDTDSAFRAEISKSFQKLNEFFKDCLDRGQKDGLIRPMPTKDMAFVLLGILNGIGRQRLFLPFETVDAQPLVMDLLKYGICNAGTRDSL